MPGHYPDRIAQHIRYIIKAPGHKALVTQLYFNTDPCFEGDPGKYFAKDPLVRNPDLIRPVTLLDESKVARALVHFDICLERAWHGPLQFPANVVAIGYCGSNLIGACTDGRIRHWDTKSAATIKAVASDKTRHPELVFSHDGRPSPYLARPQCNHPQPRLFSQLEASRQQRRQPPSPCLGP